MSATAAGSASSSRSTVDDAELGAIVTEAFRMVAPPTVLRELDEG